MVIWLCRRVKIGEAANIVGVTPETLRKWDRDGELLPDRRSKSGTRFCGAPPATPH
ncbi:MAG: MerR family DNA-binding transcriptional regulator [Spirochaetales bacterium]|nr:MerR family DNA-binding transcriptional regulator [Spirochaetales bacterium]